MVVEIKRSDRLPAGKDDRDIQAYYLAGKRKLCLQAGSCALLVVFSVIILILCLYSPALALGNAGEDPRVEYGRSLLQTALEKSAASLQEKVDFDLTLRIDPLAAELSANTRRAEGFALSVHGNKIKIFFKFFS